jgi:hypothetical protein
MGGQRQQSISRFDFRGFEHLAANERKQKGPEPHEQAKRKNNVAILVSQFHGGLSAKLGIRR